MTSPTVVRSPDALWHRTSGRVLVNPAGGTTFELHGIEALVWEALAQQGTLDDLVEDLAAVFGRAASDVRADVTPLVDALVLTGVVRCG